LQIDQTNRVTSAAGCCGDKFEAERFEPKINLRIHQTAGMDREEFHLLSPVIHRGMFDVRACLKIFQPASSIRLQRHHVEDDF
jgi:hypothetical protein